MKILQTNYNQYQQTNFKSAFPVVHWVSEVNGSYAPVAQKEVVEGFQKRIVEILQSSIKKTLTDVQKLEKQLNKRDISDKEKRSITGRLKSLYELLDVPAQKLRSYIAAVDVDYRLNPNVRSFYNVVHGTTDFSASTAYLITNPKDFNNKFAKELGKQRAIKKKLIDNGASKEEAETPEYKKALRKYNYEGFDYVNYYPRRIKDSKGATQVLHTKFEIERDTDGKFIDYRFIDARFLPEKGPESPFEKLKK